MATATSESKQGRAPTPANGVTRLLALTYNGDHRKFTFAVDGDCFKTDNLLRGVLEHDFLPQLNNTKELRYAFMEMTTYVTVIFTPYSQSIPEIFRIVLDRPDKPTINPKKRDAEESKYSLDLSTFDAIYSHHWQVPLKGIFHFLCQNREQEAQLFPAFEAEINSLLTGRHPRPMNIDTQTIEDVRRIGHIVQTPIELLHKLDQGEVDPRTMLIANAAMRAYGYVLRRTIDA